MTALVRDHMTTDVRTVGAHTPVREVLDACTSKGIHHLPVVDDAGNLLGLISDRDLKGRVLGPLTWLTDAELDKELAAMEAREVMTEEPATVPPELPLHDAARRMLDAGIGSLLVVDGERLVGILTKNDFVRAVAAGA